MMHIMTKTAVQMRLLAKLQRHRGKKITRKKNHESDIPELIHKRQLWRIKEGRKEEQHDYRRALGLRSRLVSLHHSITGTGRTEALSKDI